MTDGWARSCSGHFLELAAVDLAQVGAWEGLDEDHAARVLVGLEVLEDEPLELIFEPLVVAVHADDEGIRFGQPVLGLFGADNKVGLDDFFLLADVFGLDAGDKGFDPAFDIVKNNRVDLNDFFVFAENFGRGIAGSGKVVPLHLRVDRIEKPEIA